MAFGWLEGEDLALNVVRAAMLAITHVSQGKVQNQRVRGIR